MKTKNGLIIELVNLDQGGFRVELHIPSEHGPDPEKTRFAAISREDDAGYGLAATDKPTPQR